MCPTHISCFNTMSTNPKATGVSKPSTRRSQYRKNRRSEKNALLCEMRSLLPLPSDVTATMDTNTVLRVATTYLRLKKHIGHVNEELLATPAAQQESNKMLTALDGFALVIESSGRVMFASEQIKEHLGMSQGDVVGADILDLVHTDDYETVTSQLLPNHILRPLHTLQSTMRLIDEHEHLSPHSSDRRQFYIRMQCKNDKQTSGNTNKKSPVKYKLMEVMGKLMKESEAPTYPQSPSVVKRRSGKKKDAPARYLLVAVCREPPPSAVIEIRGPMKGFALAMDIHFRLINVPDSVALLTGYKQSDMIGKNIFDFLHPEDITQRYHKIQKVLHGLIVTTYYRFLNKMGHWMWLQCVSILKDNEGVKPWVYGVSYIISETQALSFMDESTMKCQYSNGKHLPCTGKKQLYPPPKVSKAKERVMQDMHINDIFSQRVTHPSALKVKGVCGTLMNNTYVTSENYRPDAELRENGVIGNRHSFLQNLMTGTIMPSAQQPSSGYCQRSSTITSPDWSGSTLCYSYNQQLSGPSPQRGSPEWVQSPCGNSNSGTGSLSNSPPQSFNTSDSPPQSYLDDVVYLSDGSNGGMHTGVQHHLPADSYHNASPWRTTRGETSDVMITQYSSQVCANVIHDAAQNIKYPTSTEVLNDIIMDIVPGAKHVTCPSEPAPCYPTKVVTRRPSVELLENVLGTNIAMDGPDTIQLLDNITVNN